MILQEKQGQRAANEARAADDDRTLAGGIDALAPEQLEHAERRGRNEGGVALRGAAGIVRIETIDIFMWWDLLERCISIEAVRQRHLDEDAVDRRVVGQALDPFVEV